MKVLTFIKMHGLGNDYVFIDCFPQATAQIVSKTDLPALARRVSDRHTGVGSDGLVLILPSENADARMRIFNADGSEAQMCGNAIRCVGKYLYESGLCRQTKMYIETIAGIRTLALQVKDGVVEQVTVNMGLPQVMPDVLTLAGTPYTFMSVNMGNPHAVFFRDYIPTDEDLCIRGPRIATHPHFAEGTNVECVRVRNPHELDVRVWERGSGATLACGTGACAALAAAVLTGRSERHAEIALPGGVLNVQWPEPDGHIFEDGPAVFVFDGEIRDE